MTNYDGRAFRPAGEQTGTVGEYHQDGDVIWAEFAGGPIRAGRLVGTARPDGTIDAAYCLVAADAGTAAGACVSTPTVLADGRIRLTEHWRRLDGSAGVSTVEEVPR